MSENEYREFYLKLEKFDKSLNLIYPLLIMFLQNHCNDWEKVTTCLARHNLGKLETASVLIAANLIELF